MRVRVEDMLAWSVMPGNTIGDELIERCGAAEDIDRDDAEFDVEISKGDDGHVYITVTTAAQETA